MRDKENERQRNPHADNPERTAEQPPVPPTLLPAVLQRLGLTPGLTPAGLSVDDLLATLKSERWEERAMAVRALGKLETAAPIALFGSLLHDEDAAVRAVTVHVLGSLGTHTPLHWLVAALQDPDWHVREVAVLALSKQGQRVPDEVLMTALHDKDGSVREAARFALQWSSLIEKRSASYGRLWKEEKPMQQDDTALSNGKRDPIPSANVPYESWNSTLIEYSSNAQASHPIREQAQEYATPEHLPYKLEQPEPYEYADQGAMSARGEKITSYRVRCRSHKGWWAGIIVTAIFFLGLGSVSTMLIMPHLGFNPDLKVMGVTTSSSGSTDAKPVLLPFGNPMYAAIMQKALSQTLNLTPQQILAGVKQQGSLELVAAKQGVSPNQLQKTEMSAFNTILTTAVQNGDINQEMANRQMQMLQDSSALRDKLTIMMLGINP